MPLMLVAVGISVDLLRQGNSRSELQNMLDTAVLAGASLDRKSDAERVKEAETLFAAALASAGIDQAATSARFKVVASSIVKGEATVTGEPMFGNPFNLRELKVAAKSEAEFAAPATGLGCVHVLANTNQALLLNSGASINAPNCAFNVHSTQNPAFIMNAGVTMNVANLCVKGANYIRNGGTLSKLETSCAVSPDPLAGAIPEPTVPAGCETSGVYNPGTYELSPGVHCAPIYNGSPTITFKPGLHIIKGRMIVNAGSTLIANGVTFYFPDTDSEIRANGALTMTAKAPASGPYAGILMFEKTSDAGNNANKRQYIFNGSNGEQLEGAIYLPNRDVTYNSTTNVAQTT
ncbi:MAG: pilus assembly protein, partial [Phyllobacteriaceae bacterium]|nr:pilus assembly protein [Phyllobacteriaceae bacterium]